MLKDSSFVILNRDSICFKYEFSDSPILIIQVFCFQVDIAYIPFFERYIPFFLEMKNYDLTVRRPKLAEWIEVHAHFRSAY